MGIEGFKELIKNECFVNIPISSISGQRICIDMANLIFKMRYGAMSKCIENTDMLSQEPDVEQINLYCTKLILDKLYMFLENNIQVICVFDSEHNPLRSIVNARRKKIKNDSKEKFGIVREKWLNSSYL